MLAAKLLGCAAPVEELRDLQIAVARANRRRSCADPGVERAVVIDGGINPIVIANDQPSQTGQRIADDLHAMLVRAIPRQIEGYPSGARAVVIELRNVADKDRAVSVEWIIWIADQVDDGILNRIDEESRCIGPVQESHRVGRFDRNPAAIGDILSYKECVCVGQFRGIDANEAGLVAGGGAAKVDDVRVGRIHANADVVIALGKAGDPGHAIVCLTRVVGGNRRLKPSYGRIHRVQVDPGPVLTKILGHVQTVNLVIGSHN